MTFEGDTIEDEVKQNARDQQHPAKMTGWGSAIGEEPVAMTIVDEPVRIITPVPGLSTRAAALIHNIDTVDPRHKEEARRNRLDSIERDIASINRFLPRLEEIRAYLATMPVDDDEALGEAKNLSDLKLRMFEREVTAKLESLLTEQTLKQSL